MTAETSVTKICSKELHHYSLFPVLCTKEYNSRVFISIHLSPNLDRTTTACGLKRTSYVSFLLLVSTVTRRVIILVSTTASSAPGQTSGCRLCFGLDESHSASCQRYIFFSNPHTADTSRAGLHWIWVRKDKSGVLSFNRSELEFTAHPLISLYVTQSVCVLPHTSKHLCCFDSQLISSSASIRDQAWQQLEGHTEMAALCLHQFLLYANAYGNHHVCLGPISQKHSGGFFVKKKKSM